VKIVTEFDNHHMLQGILGWPSALIPK